MSTYGDAPVAHYREGLAAQLPAPDSVPPGSMFFETDTSTLKVSNGTTAWRTVAGGGGGGMPAIRWFHTHVFGAPQSIPPGGADLVWAASGASAPSIFDLTDPTFAQATSQGLYILTLSIGITSAAQAGKIAAIEVDMGGNSAFDLSTFMDMDLDSAIPGYITTTVTAAAAMDVGDGIDIYVKHNAAGNLDFVYDMYVVELDDTVDV